MIWTLDQVRQVLRYRATYSADAQALLQGGDVYAQFLAEKLYQEIKEMAWTLAVEIDIQDMYFKWLDDEIEGMNVRKLRARWEPETTDALLLNGPMEGQRYHLQRDQLYTALSAFAHAESLDPMGEGPVVERVEYRLSGWHESERIWTFSIDT